MYRKDVDEIFNQLREYDSVSLLLRKCSPKNQLTFPWRKYDKITRLNCFDVHEDFIALGWSNGALSVVERNADEVAHSLGTENHRDNFFAFKEDVIPTWLAMRETESLIVVCSCVCTSRRNFQFTTSITPTESSVILIYRIPLGKSKKLIRSKMVRHVIKGIHHNPVLAPLYVSPLADVIISGDIRGSVVHSRYNTHLCTYHSAVLTVVPGSLKDLKLVQGSILLLTCRAFPQDRPCDDDEDEAVEILQEPAALYFLYDIASRSLVRLDLANLLPPQLNLIVSCSAPVWLPKQGLSKPLRFICSVNSVDRAVADRSGPSDAQVQRWLAGSSGVVAVVFAVHDHLQVSMERLIVLQSDPQRPVACRIPVLTSVVSTANVHQLGTASGVNMDDEVVPPPPRRSLSTSSGISASRQSATNGIFTSDSVLEKRLSLFSDRTLIVWFTGPLSTDEPAPSVLAFLQLDLYRDPEPTDSPLAASPSRLLAYSTQLGPITSIAVVPLKPWSGPLPVSPSDWTLPRGGCGGLGLEVWVQRELPDRFRDKASALVLLSTRPLCVTRLAISPFADLRSLFADDQKREQPRSQSSWYASRSLGSFRLPGFSQSKFDDLGVEQGVEALEFSTDQFEASTTQRLCEPNPTLTATQDRIACVNHRSLDCSPDGESQLGVSSALACEPRIILPDSGVSMSSDHVATVETNSISPVPQSVVTQRPATVFQEEFSTDLTSAPDSMTDAVDHGLITPADRVSVSSQSVPDGSCLSCMHNEEDDAPFNLVETVSSTSDDTWFVFSGPSPSASSSRRPSRIEQNNTSLESLLSDPWTELVPFVSPPGGQPGVAVFNLDRVQMEWIRAPKAFGEVQALCVSPDGCVVWCLRKSTSAASDGGFGYTVDVFLDKGGIRSIAQDWNADRCGRWEQDVLRRVISLDLSNHRAIFTTTSGSVKIQFGLSANRPYCQSYTWPCPDYHVHQVTLSASGVVWALASTRVSSNNNSTAVSSHRAEDLCLLSAYLPDVTGSRDHDVLPVRSLSSTTPTPSVIKSQLKSSQWIPLALPTTIQSALHQLVDQSPTMLALSANVNALFQLSLTTQRTVFGSAVVNAPLAAAEYTTGWLLCTVSNTVDQHGCAFLLPNLNPPYKADDTDWYEVAIDCPDSTRLAGTALQMLMKRMNLSNSLSYPARSILKLPTHVVRTNPDSLVNPVALCPDPLWVSVDRLTTDQPTVLLKRLRSSLSAYCWRQFRLRMQTVNPSSPTVKEHYVWRFPLLVDGLSTMTLGDQAETVPDCCLWTLNTVANELFCHLGPKHTRSLPVPESSAERDEVTAMCLVCDADNNVAHLIVATKAGHLWSRLGLSALSPVGTSWVSETVPDHWTPGSTATSDWRSRHMTFCTSAVHVNGELWITDSCGMLLSTRVELVRKSDGTSRLLSPQWIVQSSPSPSKSARPGSGIHFLSVGGASWQTKQQGHSFWAIGIPTREASKMTHPILNHSGALVYARCWCPDDENFIWSHVPAPPARSIQVSEARVWLVSNTQPRQIYLRMGLVSHTIASVDSSSPKPAPLESEIGHAWRSIPLPEPIYHALDVDCLVAATGRSATILGGQRIDALGLTQSGTFLCLSISPETLVLGPTGPHSRSRSTSIAKPTELIPIEDQLSPADR